MKLKALDLTFIGFILCIVGIIITWLILREKYFDFTFLTAIFYGFPAFIFCGFNGFLLAFTQFKTKKNLLKTVVGIFPILILIVFLVFIDVGPVVLLAKFSIIPIIITNLIWLLRLSKFHERASV